MNSTHCGDLDLPIAGVVENNLVTFNTAFICTAGGTAGYGLLSFYQASGSGNTISGTWREIFNNEVYDTGTFSITKQLLLINLFVSYFSFIEIGL